MGLRHAIRRWRPRRRFPELLDAADEIPFVLPARALVPAAMPAGTLVVGGAEPREATSLSTTRVQPSDYDREALREAWSMVADRVGALIASFYAELFVRLPEAPQMFPSSMTRQRQDFGNALVQWVVDDDPEALARHLHQLGVDHRKYDVQPRHYDIAGAALVSAWRAIAGSACSERHAAAVLGSYRRVAAFMLDGAREHAADPGSWPATVIAHRRVLRDFAVLRIRPDQPYPYRPGQYLTIEVPSHRCEWRQMSIATAPRADNSFDIHVRAIGGLGVSAALVNHTTVGQRLRLGPPRGHALVIDSAAATSGLLCIASGTGAAPITAVVQSVLGWDEAPPRLDVFVAVRSATDMYAVDLINQMIGEHGAQHWAHAYPIVSDDGGFIGARGLIEVVVPALRDWAGLGVEVLVAGPDAMMEATLAQLIGHGVPRSRIRFDQYQAAGWPAGRG